MVRLLITSMKPFLEPGRRVDDFDWAAITCLM